MSRPWLLTVFFAAVLLQAGAYGLTFMLPDLFATFGGDEKLVGQMLAVTAVATLASVTLSGHMSDQIGRPNLLAIACICISAALYLFAKTSSVGLSLVSASILLGAGWGITYSLCPVVLSEVTHLHERVRYFSMLTVFVMAGFGSSPLIAAALLSYGFAVSTAFILISGTTMISAILFALLGRLISPHLVSKTAPTSARLDWVSLTRVLQSPARIPIIMVLLGASVFAGLSNFQTVFAADRGLNYSVFFAAYMITVIICRILLARFDGGSNPYRTIAGLQYIMAASVILFIFSGDNATAYLAVGVLFGIGYGASYPIVSAMTANDADDGYLPQTMQVFALFYFIGVFGFPLIAGWMIVDIGTTPLLVLVALLAVGEATMALVRARA